MVSVTVCPLILVVDAALVSIDPATQAVSLTDPVLPLATGRPEYGDVHAHQMVSLRRLRDTDPVALVEQLRRLADAIESGLAR